MIQLSDQWKTRDPECKSSGPQKELANDVAMLYSWAKIENAPYRDFSRQPKAAPSPRSTRSRAHTTLQWKRLRARVMVTRMGLRLSAVLASPPCCRQARMFSAPLLLAGLGPERAMPETSSSPPQLPAPTIGYPRISPLFRERVCSAAPTEAGLARHPLCSPYIPSPVASAKQPCAQTWAKRFALWENSCCWLMHPAVVSCPFISELLSCGRDPGSL